jgi:hypothetical protein
MTYEFLKNGKADLTGITLLTQLAAFSKKLRE